MNTVAGRVAEEFAAYSDIPVTDRDVEHALDSFRISLDERPARRTRSVLLVAVAAVVAIVMVVGVGLARRGPESPQPVDRPVDHAVDHPVGPSSSQLVLQYWSHPCWGHGGMVWVYANGRVITEEPGYRERRLTARGLDRLEDEVVHLRGTPTDDGFSSRHPFFSGRCQPIASLVNMHGQYYNVTDNAAMANLLFDMATLPDDAWIQKEPTTYKPTTYSACYALWDEDRPEVTGPVRRSDFLSALPTQVAQLLKRTESRSYDPGCSVLTPSEATSIVDNLDADVSLDVNNGRYDFELRDGRRALMIFNVFLPDGEPAGHGG